MDPTIALFELQNPDKMKVEFSLPKGARFHNKSFFRILYNKLIFCLQRKIIPCRFKNLLLRTTGMNVGENVCIPHDIEFDPYFPELIHLRDDCLVGGECFVKTHVRKGNTLMIGKCIVDKRSLVSGMCTLLPGSVVGTHSMLSLNSTLDTKIPEGELWDGNPAKCIKRFDAMLIDKFFKPSDKKYARYYKEFASKMKAFNADESMTYLKVYYNGRYGNPGNEWYKARNVFLIFWSGAIIEFCRLLPACTFKNFLLRLTGATIGANVRIGKGVVLDHLMPQTITIEDDVVLGDYSYIDGHEYTISQTVFGRTRVGKGSKLGAHVMVRVGTNIGENVTIKDRSVVARVIPDNEVWAGAPAVLVKKKSSRRD